MSEKRMSFNEFVDAVKESIKDYALFRFDGTYRGAQIGGCQRRLAREQKRAYYFLQASWQRYLSFFTHSHGLR